MQVIDPRELNDLAAFASRGGLGHGVATTDCVAEQPDQLMYLSGDSLILLRDLGPIIIASCEGVVGWVKKDHVKFDRIASTSSPDIPSPPESITPHEDLPRTVVHSPSPPLSLKNLPTLDQAEEGNALSAPASVDGRDDRRASNPFDLDSPSATPGVESTEKGFELPTPENSREEAEELREEDEEDMRRVSLASDNSSSFGGIGGFMLGSPSPPSSANDHQRVPWGSSGGISEMADSPVTPANSTPAPQAVLVTSPSGEMDQHDLSPTSVKSHATSRSSAAWDIYDSYSRESMYVKRESRQQAGNTEIDDSQPKSAPTPQAMGGRKETPSYQSTVSATSTSPNGSAYRNSIISNSSWDDEGRAFEAARLALQRVGASKKWADADDEDDEGGDRSMSLAPALPSDGRRPSLDVEDDLPTRSSFPAEAPPRPARRRPVGVSTSTSPDLDAPPMVSVADPVTPKAATRSAAPPESAPKPSPPRSVLSSISSAEAQRPQRNGSIDSPLTPPRAIAIQRDDDTPKRLRIANPDSDDEDEPPAPSTAPSSDGNHISEASTALVTPIPPTESAFADSPSPIHPSQSPHVRSDSDNKSILLDSPLPIDTADSPREKVQPIVASMPTSSSIATISLRSPPAPGPPRRPSLAPTPVGTDKSPMRAPAAPWQTDSPSSPHSIDATRQAVEIVRKTPEAKRARGMTLVGRMEADLGQSKGPVPITFIVGDAVLASSLSVSPPLPSSASVGLGLPRGLTGGSGRISPGMKKSSSIQSSLASPLMDIDDPMRALKTSPSAYPSMRSATNPLPPYVDATSEPSQTNGMPKPGFFPRPRSRSFSAAVSKVMAKKAGPGLTIQTNIPAVPAVVSPPPTSATITSGSAKRPFFSRQASMPQASLAPGSSSSNQPPTPISPAISLSPDIVGFIHANESSSSLAIPPSSRSSSFSFRGRGSKTSLLTPTTATGTSPNSASALGFSPIGSKPLASPVSNKDYEDTVKADGLDFEIIQPKSKRIGSTLSPSSSEDHGLTDGAALERKGTVISSTSGRSLRTLPDTDEWGFIKDKSPTPEVFVGRAGGAGQRALEQKWLGIINTPITGNSGPPKKVRKLAIESGIPASLRGRVYAWFMTPIMSARRPGLYQELLDHDREDKRLADRIDKDVEAAYPDHSIYSETSTGQTDLRSILRAYSHFATGGYRPEMSLIAGMLLIHCVAEDAFWLLSGFVNGTLRDYYAQPTKMSAGKAAGMRVDSAVFAGVLAGSEPKLAKLFRDIGLHPIAFLEEWYAKLFLRCLPWPTALRIIDAVVAEGPRFLLIASLTILTLSRDRLLALPRTYTDVLAYLRDLPQDALLLPEGFMKACENVKFKEDDMRRLRAGVEKELGLSVA